MKNEPEKIFNDQSQGVIVCLNRITSRILCYDQFPDWILPHLIEATEIIQDSLDATKRALRNRQDFILLEQCVEKLKSDLSSEIEANIQLKKLIASNKSRQPKSPPVSHPPQRQREKFNVFRRRRFLENYIESFIAIGTGEFSVRDVIAACNFSESDKNQIRVNFNSTVRKYQHLLEKSVRPTIAPGRPGANNLAFYKLKIQNENTKKTPTETLQVPVSEVQNAGVPSIDSQQPGTETTPPGTN